MSKATPDFIGEGGLPADAEAVDELLHRLGENAPDTLLEILARSRSRSVRRRAFDRLIEMGPEASEAVAARLASQGQLWYVLRNLLSLMGELKEWPGTWSVSTFTRHRHAAVRREALKSMLRMPVRRDWALCRLMEERDAKSLTLGLTAALENPPPDALPLLLGLAEDEKLDPYLRRLAIRALVATGMDEALEILLNLTTVPPSWYDRLLDRPKLARKSPVVLEALAGLRRGWPDDPRVGRILRSASVDLSGPVRQAAAGEPVG